MNEIPLPSCPIKVEDIKRFLPHRSPFLFIDRVLEYELEKYLRASKHIPADEPVFQGHFPGMPLFPGVLTVESMAQAACMLHALFLYRQSGDILGTMVPYLGTIEAARFRSAVRPGNTLIIQVRQTRRLGNLVQFNTEAWVEDKLVAKASLSSFLKNEEDGNDR